MTFIVGVLVFVVLLLCINQSETRSDLHKATLQIIDLENAIEDLENDTADLREDE